jgi:hypothetical protein
MTRHRLSALIVVFAMMLVSGLAPSALAQTAAERFEQALAEREQLPVLGGPYAFDLVQTPGILTVYRAGVDVSDFIAHAEFTNPPQDDGVPWEYGFQFHTAGTNEDHRVFVVSTGTWNFSIGPESPYQTAAAPSLNTEPGATNTLDLVVVGDEATFGINGEFAGTVLLPELSLTSGDVYASTGFFSDLIVPNRVIGLRDFTISAPPGSAAAARPAAQAGPLPPPRPVTLHAGSCAALGDVAQVLTDATYPIGEAQGQPSAVVSETSFTRVSLFLDELLASPHAVNVAESAENPGTSIACGDIGGVLDELGAFVIGLQEQNGSGYRGVAYIASDPQTGASTISVFLAPPVVAAEAAPVEPEPALPEEPAPAATPDAVIVIESLAEATPQATPAG